MEFKTPPHDVKAEQALLGSILNDPTIISDLKVKSEDFYRNVHQAIFETMIELKDKTNIITVLERIESIEPGLVELEYLNDCTTTAFLSATHNHFEDIVIRKSVLRKQIHLAYQIADQAYNNIDSIDLFKQAEEIDCYDDDEMVFIRDIVGEELDNIDKYNKGLIQPGLMTKITGIDKLANGFKNGDLIYIGARPSMGKSALANQIALNLAEQGKKIGIFSLEMQNAKIVRRMLVNQAKVHLRLIQEKKIDSQEMRKLTNACSKLYNQNIAISDKAGQRVVDILRKAKRHKKKYGMDILVIDHFHLIKPTQGKGNYEQRSFDSQMLKEVAKELNIPVICLCQLNRGLEARKIDDRLPILSDLKETGSLEQDGDMILFIDRQDYWHKDEVDYENNHEATIHFAKNRDGETGVFKLKWYGGTQRFENI